MHTNPVANNKRIDYDYDLISGKVNSVTYQPNKPDMFIERYEYDADNRITDVYTSRDGIVQTHEAKYFYYPHGPLARVEIGEDKVQGMDYYYTLQGWLKGINSSAVTENNDPSKDATQTGTAKDTLNRYVPKDQLNTVLSYYKNDYMAANGTAAPLYEWNALVHPFYAGQPNAKYKGLYNGNIAGIATGLPAVANGTNNKSLSWTLEEYKYDQLNRIVASLTTLPKTNGGYLTDPNNRLTTNYAYDKNGNITKLNRMAYTNNGTTATRMDSLTYIYKVNSTTGKLENNQLFHVKDLAAAGAFAEDIDDQGAFTPPTQNSSANTNYQYDEIGQLTTDNAEKIESIQWNVYGKIKRIYFKNGKPSILFLYDATGNRIAKLLKNTNALSTQDTTYATTYYWRDAQGNILATESKRFFALPTATSVSHATEVEYNIYGSSRLGTLQDTIAYNITTLSPYGKYKRYGALRQYELTNHLGNVLATVSDVKTYAGSSGYTNTVLSAQHYYPFGMQMPGRTFTAPAYGSLLKYRFGFNGQERDIELGSSITTATFWEYDSRTAHRWNVDPLTHETPFESPYCAMGDNPILNIDPDGNSWTPVDKDGKSVSLNDKEKINGYNWVGYDKDDKGNNVAKPNTVETAYTFGAKGMQTLSSEGYEKHQKWNSYESLSTGDASTDKKLATLHPDVQDQMKSLILMSKLRYDIDLRVTDGFRTYAQQDKLFAKGRTAPGSIVTKARGGQSNHNFGLAIDVVPFENGKLNWDTKNYPIIGRIGISRGLEWGGNWKFTDKPHFQNLFGKSLKELRAIPKDANGLPKF